MPKYFHRLAIDGWDRGNHRFCPLSLGSHREFINHRQEGFKFVLMLHSKKGERKNMFVHKEKEGIILGGAGS